MNYFLKLSVLIVSVFFSLAACNSEKTTLVFDDYDWEIEEIKTFNNEVYRPLSMWFDHEGKLVIRDMSDQDKPIKIFKDGIVYASIPSGRGPGEVQYFGGKFFSESKKDRYVFDTAQLRMLKFDEKYNYIEDRVDENSYFGVYTAGIYSDSLLYTISNDYILQIKNMNKPSTDADPYFTLYDSDYEILDPLRNYFLRQSFYFADEGQDLYLALEHSSLIMHIDSEFNFRYTFGPDPIGIAINNKDGFYALPRLGHQREGLRDLQVHGDYLFAILNGMTYGKHIQIRHMADFDSLLDIVGHGEILLIFDRHTLEFKRAIELPLPASQLALTDEHIYLLNYIDDVPAIYIYKNHIN